MSCAVGIHNREEAICCRPETRDKVKCSVRWKGWESDLFWCFFVSPLITELQPCVFFQVQIRRKIYCSSSWHWMMSSENCIYMFKKKNYTANACKAWCFFRLGATHGPGLKFHWFTLMHSLLHLQLLLYHGQGCSRSRAYPGNTGWEYNLYGIQVKLDVMKLWNFTVIQAQVQIRDPWLSCQVALPTCCPIHINRWDVFHQWYLNTLICLSHIAMKNNGNKTYWTVRT